MGASYYLTCLWPGLPELWWRGRLSSIPTAVAFALALNMMLIVRYRYPEWLSGGLVTLAFWVGLVIWGMFVYRSVRELPELITPRAVCDEPDVFPEAHAAFLRGEWEAAEDYLNEVLAIEPRDPPALLLLTSVYRHQDRLESAQALLDEIRKLEVADRWWLEVEAESKRLDRAMAALDEEEQADDEVDTSEVKSDETAEAESEPPNDAADLTEPPRMAA